MFPCPISQPNIHYFPILNISFLYSWIALLCILCYKLYFAAGWFEQDAGSVIINRLINSCIIFMHDTTLLGDSFPLFQLIVFVVLLACCILSNDALCLPQVLRAPPSPAPPRLAPASVVWPPPS